MCSLARRGGSLLSPPVTLTVPPQVTAPTGDGAEAPADSCGPWSAGSDPDQSLSRVCITKSQILPNLEKLCGSSRA